MGGFLVLNGMFDMLLVLAVPLAILLGVISMFFPKFGRAIETNGQYIERLKRERIELLHGDCLTDEDWALADAMRDEILTRHSRSPFAPRLRTH